MLLEIAIGDAYGAGFEFCARAKIARANTLEAYVDHELGIAAGHYTDDTQMSVAVAETMLSGAELTSAHFADAFVRCFKRDPRRGYAKGLQGLLEECADGTALRARIRPQSRRNGAAMRSVPLGLIANREALLAAAAAQARVTHDTPEGIASSRAVAVMAHALIHERAALAELPALVARHAGCVPRLDWNAEVECDAEQTLHAVATALLRHRSMAALLRDCVDFGGDVDSVAAIALGLASLSGEYANDLPAALSSGLENGAFGRDFLAGLDAELARRFAAVGHDD